MKITALSPTDESDTLALAGELIGEDGLSAIDDALAQPRDAAISAPEVAGQLLLIEAIFEMLEALEQDLAAASVYSLALGFDRDVAQMAADLLLVAHFPDGDGDAADLGDGTVLLLAAFMIAAGLSARGFAILYQAEKTRPSPRFQQAAAQLRLLIQPGGNGVR